MTQSLSASHERVIRVSLVWIVFTALMMVILGGLGGLMAQWWQPNLTPLPQSQEALVSTIQEVTISPSTATAALVKESERSVVLISREARPEAFLSTGLTVTSDGLIATVAALPEEGLVAIDSEGRQTPLTLVGEDVVYGISYLRAGRGVFSPFDVRDNEVEIGATLVALSRNPETLEPRIQLTLVQDYRLPETADPIGWQRLLGGSEFSERLMVGSPLLDDEGRVAALLLPGENGRFLPGIFLSRSLARVARGQLEENSSERLGFTWRYVFVPQRDNFRAFALAVENVTARGSAASQGVRPGDLIFAINGKDLAWEDDIMAAWQTLPVTLSLQRAGQARTVSLSPAPATPTP